VGDAKRIIVKPIAAADANRIVKQLHYSGKIVQNSQLHLGVFLDGKCGGAMQFGPSTDKRKTAALVRGTKWNDFLELNRMAFADWLPRNSESRAIGYAMRWLRATYPWLQWVISFSDGTQCGDGTIYRASGFLLTAVKTNRQILRLPDGRVVNKKTLDDFQYTGHNGRHGSSEARAAGAKPLPGYQLRYVYFLDPSARERLTVPVLPFSEIDKRGAGMYKGKRRERSSANAAPAPTGEGGVTPTRSLHTSGDA
jgi:hypothetical protein